MVRRSWIVILTAVVFWTGTSLFAQERVTPAEARRSIFSGGTAAVLGPRPETRPADIDAPHQKRPSRSDPRTQYPWLLANSYLGISAGYIHYPFSFRQLEPGSRADSVRIGRAAGQIVLFGRHFNRYFSAQMGYTRPVRYVTYVNVNRTGSSKTVWMVFGEFTLRARAPVNERVAIYGDASLGITNRRGFTLDGAPVVKDANFASLFVGGGLEYSVNTTWDVLAGLTYAPGSALHTQPRTLFVSGGVRYNLRPLSAERVEKNAQAGFVFPENLVQIGFSTGRFGYGVNKFFASRVPIFWDGHVAVDRGFSIHYQRNLFHSRKMFAFDVGTSVSQWRSEKNREKFVTLSVYTLLRLTVLRTRAADWFVSYSPAGPSRMTRKVVDDIETGTNRFTFQDFMGMGVFAGRNRNIMLGITIVHYSNGNLFPRNPGVSVPLTFSAGYTF